MYFTEEHHLFRKSLQDFLQKEVVPHIDKWEETGTVERFIWTKMGDMGFFGLNAPEEYGGLQLDLFYTVIFFYGCPSIIKCFNFSFILTQFHLF